MSTQDNNGRFASGTSGNPSGRPRGSRNKSTLLMEALLEGEASELTRQLIDMAKAGNAHAMGICMDRLMPPYKDRLVRFDLPPIQTLDDVSRGMASIELAVSQGEITPLEGETMFRILASHANLLINTDLKRRVEILEAGPPANEDKIEIVKRYR